MKTSTFLWTVLVVHLIIPAALLFADPRVQARAAVLWHHVPPVFVLLPSGFARRTPAGKEFKGESFTVRLTASSFAQGNAAYLEVLPATPKGKVPDDLTLQLSGKAVPLDRFSWGLRSLIAFSPEEKVGNKTITVQTGGRKQEFKFDLAKTSYETFRSSMNLGEFSNTTTAEKPEIIAFIKKCQDKKARVFSKVSTDMLSNRLAHPRENHNVTSPFYCKRIVDRFRMDKGKKINLEPWVNIHNGLDLGGTAGEPIYAMADGRVVIAEKMHYEGNFVSIDHGNGIFSGYLHQSSLNVKEGQMVKAGDLLGRVGATGMATGPHLHIAFYIRGIPVDPMSVLSLPIRN